MLRADVSRSGVQESGQEINIMRNLWKAAKWGEKGGGGEEEVEEEGGRGGGVGGEGEDEEDGEEREE